MERSEDRQGRDPGPTAQATDPCEAAVWRDNRPRIGPSWANAGEERPERTARDPASTHRREGARRGVLTCSCNVACENDGRALDRGSGPSIIRPLERRA